MDNHKVMLNHEVNRFLDGLQHPLRKEIDALRQLILSVSPDLIENIKWNGPNYAFDGNDRITMKLQPPKQVQLIFHRGAKVREVPENKLINDTSGLLSWKTNDRAIVTFKNMEDIISGKLALVNIVREWLTVK